MSKIKDNFFSVGMAMFSMFFGAGNITFPLMVGQTVEKGLIFALLGLAITAICIPFSGLLGTTLFHGDYYKFFYRIGKVPGMFIIIVLIGLIGPFGGIPRCMTLTYATLKIYFTSLNLLMFNTAGCIVLFFCCFKKNRILGLVGYFLSPALIIFLVIIMIKGLFFGTAHPMTTSAIEHPFFYGLKEGYNTMDLLASFFFSSLIYQRLKAQIDEKRAEKSLFLLIFKSTLIGASMLTVIYVGFSYVAANYSLELQGVPLDQVLGTLGHIVVGPYAGLIVCVSIALTCLTTMIALSVICAEFLQQKICQNKINYETSLIIILAITGIVSLLKFNGIVKMLKPVLMVIYPTLLVLSVFNILYKLFGIKVVKTPVYITLFVVLYSQYLM